MDLEESVGAPIKMTSKTSTVHIGSPPICRKCETLEKILKFGLSNRGYWLVTELFVELHNERDYCSSGEPVAHELRKKRLLREWVCRSQLEPLLK